MNMFVSIVRMNHKKLPNNLQSYLLCSVVFLTLKSHLLKERGACGEERDWQNVGADPALHFCSSYTPRTG